MTNVYFARARVEDYHKWWLPKDSLVSRMERAFYKAGFQELISKGQNVGIKVHVGEPGNVHYLRPIYVSKIVEIVKALGGNPTVIETTGLGAMPGRTYSSKHLEAARKNGFTPEVMGAPIEIIDGERGLDTIIHEGVSLARGLERFDSLLVLSHVTAHIQAGFGGALENLALGLVSKPGKFYIHHTALPLIDPTRCKGHLKCVEICPVGAAKGNPPSIDKNVCVGCNECLDLCPSRAIKVPWTDGHELNRRIARNAKGVVSFRKKIGYINFFMDIIPHCDCHPHSDIPFVPDLGILLSRDPVAIDRASIDRVNESPCIPGSAADIPGSENKNEDKFRLINPETDWKIQLDHAETLGLGSQEYDLEII